MRKRAFLLGMIFSILIGMLDPYLMLRGINATFCWEYWTPAAIFVLLVLVFLSATHPKLKLTSSELLLIFIMTSTASVLPSMGFMSSFLPIVVGFKYFATPVNQWSEYIIKRTRPILMVQDQKAVTWFYEGLPPGESIPYHAWLPPMSFMLMFMLIFSFLSICLMVLFRKQWIEKERLVYPLTILPLEMVKKKDGGGRLPALFKDKLFWLAFGLVFVFYLSNWISHKLTGTSMISLSGNISLFRKSVSFSLNPHFAIMGLAYLVPRSVSLSLWLFHVLFTVQSGFLSLSGFKLPGMNDPYGGRSIVTTFEGAGGMLMLVIALFWRARKHLSDCCRKAFGRSDIDDSGEMLSYRTAVFGSLISFLIMTGLMRYFGMPWFTSFTFMFFTVIVFIGLSRIVCQAGLPATRAQCIPPVYTSYLLPPNIVTPQGYLAMGLQYSWAADIRSSIMASTGHTLKICEETKIPMKLVFAGIITAIVVSYISSAWMHIYSGYTVGTLNASIKGSGGPWFFGDGMSRLVANLVIPNMTTPITRDIIVSRYIFMAIGAFVMGCLMLLHSKFLWWPVHYIGFPIAETLPLRQWWFAIFLAWLIKGLILKFGGHNVYKKSVSFFLGIILSNTVWTVVEVVLNLIDKAKLG